MVHHQHSVHSIAFSTISSNLCTFPLVAACVAACKASALPVHYPKRSLRLMLLDIVDPAILTHSIRSMQVGDAQDHCSKPAGGVARTSGTVIAQTIATEFTSPSRISSVAKFGAASASSGSAGSSTTARRSKNGSSPNVQRVTTIRTASTWRGNHESEGFVKGNVPDQFGITGDHGTHLILLGRLGSNSKFVRQGIQHHSLSPSG